MYSSQRALSFLPELKRNKFAWDILNQSHRFSMFWKNASTGDICSLNTTFECCFIWRNKQRAGSPRSHVRGRSLVILCLTFILCSHSRPCLCRVSCFIGAHWWGWWAVCDVIEINIGQALQLSVECHQNCFPGMWLRVADISGKFVTF